MKMNRIIPWVSMLAMILFATAANATFHLWRMDELYSNADGSVQFLELVVFSTGEGFVSGHTLSVSGGGVTHSFTVPNDLQGDTNGKHMLFATQGFAALGVVAPDFVIPNGFFPKGGGTVNWADVDGWTYPGLPADGRTSLNRDAPDAVNSPQNFADQIGTVNLAAAPALNFQALWWRAPAGSESGWGLNITHQGDVLFATWFTYDADGSGMWLVMPDTRKTATNVYAGSIYRTTGPAFSAVPFSPAQVVVTPVGSATFTFSDADNGSFAYTVGTVTQSKAITRQVYSSPLSTCAADGTASTAGNYQDLWWRAPAASESGWGLNITHQGDILFATWFTYDANGKGLWLVMPDTRRTASGVYTGSIYRTVGPAFSAVPFNPAQVVVTEVGSATLAFADPEHGTFTYGLGGVTQTKAIVRQSYATPASVCR
ncbi:MAG TPA: hypothetical protein VFE23_19545 [Usitatibacter sp.]|jgi:hypothetical protein|nr:hypothetical protein [Usitatibacter sp.]